MAAPSWDTPRAGGAEAAGGKGSGAEAEVLRCMVGEKGQLRSVWHLPDGCAALQPRVTCSGAPEALAAQA